MEKYSLILNQLTALIKQYSDIDIMQDYKKISIEDFFFCYFAIFSDKISKSKRW